MSDIRLVRASGAFRWFGIYRLYKSSFPKNEQKPFFFIRRMQKKGKTDVWCFERAGKLLGFASTVNGTDKTMIDYLAIKKKKRGQGIGKEAMRLLFEEYGDRGVFLEIDRVLENVPNAAELKRRKRFYLSCGMEELGVLASVFGVEMELLGRGCTMDFDKYKAFYRDNNSEYAAENIKRIE